MITRDAVEQLGLAPGERPRGAHQGDVRDGGGRLRCGGAPSFSASSLLIALPQIAQARPQATPRLTVFAAASLTEVFQRIDRTEVYNFGGVEPAGLPDPPGRACRRVRLGQPEVHTGPVQGGPRRAAEHLRLEQARARDPAVEPAGLRSVFDLRRKDVKLVIGTAGVPIGAYTRQVLRKLGMTSALSKVVGPEPDVKSIVGKVALGEADAGFVYRTDINR